MFVGVYGEQLFPTFFQDGAQDFFRINKKIGRG